MNDGHTVVGIDGLKIEPLPAELSGVRADGTRVPFEPPMRDAMSLYEALDERVMAGFGGVAEYGITVRWDKNFLKLVRLLLERRAEFALFGGVRFGGTVTLRRRVRPAADGFDFDHVALCMGAGKPTTLDIPNGLARGVRTASRLPDGAAAHRRRAARFDRQHAGAPAGRRHRRRPDGDRHGDRSRSPTTSVQVEKFLDPRRGAAAARRDAFRARWNAEEREIAEEFLVARARHPQRARARPRARAAPRGSWSCCATGAARRSSTAGA